MWGQYQGFWIDRYRLDSRLGAGGMGEVYSASEYFDPPSTSQGGVQRPPLRRVAIKLIDVTGNVSLADLSYQEIALGSSRSPIFTS